MNKTIKIIKKSFNLIGLEICKVAKFPWVLIARKNSPKLKDREAITLARKRFEKEIVACEIGVFEGEHAERILERLKVKKIYLIDPYEKYKDYESDGSYGRIKNAKKKAHDLLKKYKNKIVWIEDYSDNAVKKIKEEVDLVYIDGNHYSPYVDRDLDNFYKITKKGGVLSGHDYNSLWPDVIRAVKNFSKMKKKKFVHGWGSDWLIIK
jgi:SAM-dependent methyltransferase